MTPTSEETGDFDRWFGSSFRERLGRRYGTMHAALSLAMARGARRIVETGTTRKAGNWLGDGQSTCVLGAFAERAGAHLWTCDLSAESIMIARAATERWSAGIAYHVGDSVAFLAGFEGPIDLLYLDSWDFDAQAPGPAQSHALREAEAALHALHDRSVIVIDDCDLPHGGKGGRAIPFLLGEGWEIALSSYQVVLVRRP